MKIYCCENGIFLSLITDTGHRILEMNCGQDNALISVYGGDFVLKDSYFISDDGMAATTKKFYSSTFHSLRPHKKQFCVKSQNIRMRENKL